MFLVEAYVRGHASNAQTSGGTITFAARIYRAGTSYTFDSSTFAASTALNGTWTRQSAYLTMPALAQSVQFYISVDANVTSGERYYFDQLAVTKVGSTNTVTANTFESKVATGTAPLTVASSTMVLNLNAEKVGGYAASPNPYVNTAMVRNSYAQVAARTYITSVSTTATAAGTTTLTVSSNGIQVFTGSTTQTVLLPTTTVLAGASWQIINNSTGAVTVNASGGATVATVSASGQATFLALIDTPTTAAHWKSW